MSVSQLKNLESRLSKLEQLYASLESSSQKYDDNALVSRLSVLEKKIDSIVLQVNEKQNKMKEHCDEFRAQLDDIKCKCVSNCNDNNDNNDNNDVSEVQDEEKPVKTTGRKKK
jgi:hypothetical protein